MAIAVWRKATVCAGILLWVWSVAAGAPEHELELLGIAKGPDGKFLAIVKDVGIVGAGDTVKSETPAETRKWLIVDITANGMKAKIVERVSKRVEVVKLDPKPSKPQGLRDPFRPVGYLPE